MAAAHCARGFTGGIGDPADFDQWARLVGDPAWSYAAMLPFFKRAEQHPYATERPGDLVHGDSGPISVAPLSHPWHHADDASNRVTKEFIEAAGGCRNIQVLIVWVQHLHLALCSVAMGFPRNDDFGHHTEGVGCNEVHFCQEQ